MAEDNEWAQCPGCHAIIYRKRLMRTLYVCPDCGLHWRIPAHERIAQLLDDGSVELIELPVPDSDPLGFVDTKPYPQRLRAARDATGLDEAVVLATGTIGGTPVVVAVMDFRFLGGSLGSAAGELVTIAAEIALRRHIPLLVVTASGGARMQEGAFSLMQMVKTSQALAELDAASVLTISLITDPTYGGVAASFATLCDVIVAEPGARLGFAGPRVIKQTIRQTLPPGFQTAEFLLAHGLIDMIRPRGALRTTLARLLSAGTASADEHRFSCAARVPRVTVRDPGQLPERDAWEAVRLARHLGRPTALDYAAQAFEDFEELRGDRIGGDCPAIVGGPARIDGIPVILIGHQKGHTASDLAKRHYGMPVPAGYRKAARLMRLANKLALPVVTLVDTPGAYPGIEAEEQGQAIAVAESIRLMASLTVPVIAVVTGEGGSGGALAISVADRVLACANAVYSVISPEGCAAILWSDPSMAPVAAAALGVDARELLIGGIVDGVIPEPGDGAHNDHHLAAQRVREAIVDSLIELSAVDRRDLRGRRHARFRAFGAPAGIRDDLLLAGRGGDDAPRCTGR
jgi:acyl-CoA carboxylase subunit beta